MKICAVNDEKCTRYYAKGFCKRHYMSWWRYGDPQDIRPKGMIGKQHSLDTLSKMRQSALKRISENRGHIFTSENMSGEKHPFWKGDDAGYEALHVWARRRIPIEKCSKCGATKNLDLANLSGEYKRELSDWAVMCRSCHMYHDRKEGIWKHPRFA